MLGVLYQYSTNFKTWLPSSQHTRCTLFIIWSGVDKNYHWKACMHMYCVIPENIHTPTTKGISRKSPPPSYPEFPFLEHKSTPPPLRNFHKFYVHPPHPLEKIVLARKCVRVKVNTPNTQLSALHVTAVHSRSIVTSEDTHKENIQQFIKRK